MNKIYLTTILILSFTTIISAFIAVTKGYENDSLQSRLSNTNGNLELLIKQRKKDYDAKIILRQRIEEFEKISKDERECFSWTDDISSSLIVKRLRQ